MYLPRATQLKIIFTKTRDTCISQQQQQQQALYTTLVYSKFPAKNLHSVAANCLSLSLSSHIYTRILLNQNSQLPQNCSIVSTYNCNHNKNKRKQTFLTFHRTMKFYKCFSSFLPLISNKLFILFKRLIKSSHQ
jgi:hypothetical protein